MGLHILTFNHGDKERDVQVYGEREVLNCLSNNCVNVPSAQDRTIGAVRALDGSLVGRVVTKNLKLKTKLNTISIWQIIIPF